MDIENCFTNAESTTLVSNKGLVFSHKEVICEIIDCHILILAKGVFTKNYDVQNCDAEEHADVKYCSPKILKIFCGSTCCNFQWLKN